MVAEAMAQQAALARPVMEGARAPTIPDRAEEEEMVAVEAQVELVRVDLEDLRIVYKQRASCRCSRLFAARVEAEELEAVADRAQLAWPRAAPPDHLRTSTLARNHSSETITQRA